MLINYIPLDIQFPLKFAALDKVPEVSICDGEFVRDFTKIERIRPDKSSQFQMIRSASLDRCGAGAISIH